MRSRNKQQKALAELFATLGKKSNKGKPSDYEILSFSGQLPEHKLEHQLHAIEKRISELEKSDRKKPGRLPVKKNDYSEIFDQAKLTHRQMEVASLKYEFELPTAEIARKIGRHRSTVQEHLERAISKMKMTKAALERRKQRAGHTKED